MTDEQKIISKLIPEITWIRLLKSEILYFSFNVDAWSKVPPGFQLNPDGTIMYYTSSSVYRKIDTTEFKILYKKHVKLKMFK